MFDHYNTANAGRISNFFQQIFYKILCIFIKDFNVTCITLVHYVQNMEFEVATGILV